MPPSGDNRSIHAGKIENSIVGSGDHMTATMTTHVTLPAADSVDPKAELSALRDLLAALTVPESRKLNNGLQEAEDEIAKSNPDKGEVADAIQRALNAAKSANGFADQIEKLTPRVAALASWIGPAGHTLLSLLGLSA